MDQPQYILKNGTKVVTHDTLEPMEGLLSLHNASRKTSTEGEIQGVVGGYGGDLYWVSHHKSESTIYCFTEFELK